MVDEELFNAQKSLLADVYVKGRKDFLCCRKSQFYKPELVILNSGRYYIDRGLTTCKRILYCSECNKAYLYKKKLLLTKVEEFIQKENLAPTMLTLHIPHKISDNLSELRIKLDKATRSFLSTRSSKLMKELNQSVGNESYVYRNDITLTDSGWNPHCHIVMLNRVSYSEREKNQLVDSFAYQLEQAGLYLNRLDKYYKSNLIHFREDSTSLSYLTKYNKDLMELAITNPERYIELAQSGNKTKVPSLVAFKKGLMDKVTKSLSVTEQPEQEVRRIALPESFLSLSASEIKDKCSCLI